MIVELYGLPASGKTTYAERLSKEMSWDVVKMKTKKEILWYNLLFAFRHPIKWKALFIITILWGRGEGMFYSKFVNLFLVSNAKYMAAKKNKNAIIDQGHFQIIPSLFQKKSTTKHLKQIIRFFPRPDTLVVFDIPEEERRERLAHRGYWGREHMSEKKFNEWVESSLFNDALFKREIVPNLSTRAIVVKKVEDLKSVSDTIA